MAPHKGHLFYIDSDGEKSSCVKLEGLGLWYFVCSFIEWTSNKIFQIIALG